MGLCGYYCCLSVSTVVSEIAASSLLRVRNVNIRSLYIWLLILHEWVKIVLRLVRDLKLSRIRLKNTVCLKLKIFLLTEYERTTNDIALVLVYIRNTNKHCQYIKEQ